MTPARAEVASAPRGFGGDGGWEKYRVPERTYRLGMWFALTGIVMLFAAFTSALVVRKGMSFDWILFSVPRVLWLNTFVLVASSATLELSRRSLSAGAANEFIRWLSATVILGLGFLGGQLVAWRELASRGIYLATNPGSSFFYVLTAAHGIHLLGGVVALAYVVSSRPPYRHRTGAPDACGCGRDLLALHGCTLDLSVFRALAVDVRLLGLK